VINASRSRRAVVLLVVIGALLTAANAQAIIQVQRGISGVRLGMSPGRVKASLGTPAKVKKGKNDFGRFTQFVYTGGITVTFQGDANVTAVATTGRGDLTPSGVGVGATENQVRNGVPGVTCQTVAGTRSCQVGALLPGRRVTDFLFRNGKVSRVTVGFVID
jgi:hypothetical protein